MRAEAPSSLQITIAHTQNPDGAAAADALAHAVTEALGGAPHFVVAWTHAESDLEGLARGLHEAFPGVALHAGTSAAGVMTREGAHRGPGVAGVFALRDPRGSYGSAWAACDDPRESGRRALRSALERADRLGELPRFVWVSGAPGAEEQVLAGIDEVLGGSAPIFGGSTADETLSGEWAQLTDGRVERDGVSVSVGFPSTPISFAIHSGYAPTGRRGVVTRAEGRTLYEIDGRPAVDVYNEWTGKSLDASADDVLAQTTMGPLGRVLSRLGDVELHTLVHPCAVGSEGQMELFARVRHGDTLELMRGEVQALVERAGRVTDVAMRQDEWTPADVAGGLVTYCAGCMIAVGDALPQAAAGVDASLGGAPFLGSFTYGEQGAYLDGRNRHGNLMISALLFHR